MATCGTGTSMDWCCGVFQNDLFPSPLKDIYSKPIYHCREMWSESEELGRLREALADSQVIVTSVELKA